MRTTVFIEKTHRLWLVLFRHILKIMRTMNLDYVTTVNRYQAPSHQKQKDGMALIHFRVFHGSAPVCHHCRDLGALSV